MALEESPSRVGRLGVPSRRSAGQAYAEQTFFSPAQSTVPASRFPSSSEKALSGGHFGSQIRESAQERQLYCFAMAKRSECSLSVTGF